ncbi:MAG TPA: DUF4836 family protein [Bacteroidales bacterium]|nr:DUF4836 family protein [Bacteroidales bacterium]
MKRQLTIILALLIAAAFLWSCSKTSDKINHIPKETFAVLMVDGSQQDFAKNTDMLKENEDYEEMMEEVKQISEKLYDLLQDVMEDPTKSGMLLNKDMYVYGYSNDKDILVAANIGIKQKVFEENLELLSKELEFELEMEEKDGIKYTMPDNDVIIGYSKDLLLFVAIAEGYNTDLEKELFRLFNLKKDESIAGNKDFKEFSKNCKDVNFWISSNVAEDVTDAESISMIEKLIGIEISENYGHIHFDAGKSEWIMTLKLRFNESVQEADWNKVMKNLEEFGLLDELFGRSQSWEDEYNYEDDWDEDWEDYDDSYEEMTDEEWEEFFEEFEEEVEEEK